MIVDQLEHSLDHCAPDTQTEFDSSPWSHLDRTIHCSCTHRTLKPPSFPTFVTLSSTTRNDRVESRSKARLIRPAYNLKTRTGHSTPHSLHDSIQSSRLHALLTSGLHSHNSTSPLKHAHTCTQTSQHSTQPPIPFNQTSSPDLSPKSLPKPMLSCPILS